MGDTAVWIQAGATVVLMAVTAWYVKLTSEISAAAKESARLSERAAAAAEASAVAGASAVAVSERTMLLAHMPQLVVTMNSASRDGLLIVVQNTGPTPAYNIEVVLFFGTSQQPRSEPWRLSRPLVPGDHDNERITLPIDYDVWAADKVFESQSRYNDAVGNRFMARLWHYRDWDEESPQSSIYRIDDQGKNENLTTNVALTP